MEYVLKPLKKLTGEEITISSDPTGELIKLDPDRNVKYVMILDVGDMAPPEIRNHVKSASEMMTSLLGSDRVLFAPRRPGQGELPARRAESPDANREGAGSGLRYISRLWLATSNGWPVLC